MSTLSGTASKLEKDNGIIQEQEVVNLIKRYLLEARNKKSTGKITFEIDLQDGGVRDRWVTVRSRER